MLLFLLACTGREPADPADDTAAEFVFVPLEGPSVPPDVTTVRLCAEAADPDAASDPIYIDCAVETGRLAAEDPGAASALVVMAYNVEQGHRVDDILAWLAMQDPTPDVLLLSEADRGCGRTGQRHIAWEIAAALGMDLAYAVEFMEVSGAGAEVTAVCEHGNAVLSRFPMGNVAAYRHAENISWYTPPEARGASWSTRLGGRIAVAADIRVGDRYVHLTAVHLESGLGDQAVRAAQAAETVERNAGARWPVLIGGDTNAGLYVADLASGGDSDAVTQAWLSAGYVDAHADLPVEDRTTAPEYGFVLDLIFGLGVGFSAPGICATEACAALSDHYPVWATAAPLAGGDGG